MSAPEITDQMLQRHAGSASYQRGVEYAARGMVIAAVWSADRTDVSLTVRGTREKPYHARVSLTPRGALASSCSCPMRTACKHVVAGVIVARTRVADDQPGAETPTARTGEAGSEAEAGERARPRSTWQRLLEGDRGAHGPFALGIELRNRPRYAVDRWQGRTVAAATPRVLATEPGEVTLAVRPLVQSASTGAWIKTGAEWERMRRLGAHPPRDQLWLAEFAALARDPLEFGGSADWLTLDRVTSALAFRQLLLARDAGVPLVPVQKHTDLRFGERTRIVQRVSDDGAGGLRLAAEVYLDDELCAPGSVTPLGSTAVYHWEVIGNRIVITLAPADLSAEEAALLRASDGLAVPQPERDAFFRQALPRMLRHGEVATSEGVELPDLATPEVVLDVVFSSGHVVRYAFSWEYSGFGRFGFGPQHDAVRDADAEAERQAEVEQLWARQTTLPFRIAETLTDLDAAEFVAHVLPELEDHGVRVVITGTRREYRELSGDPEITVRTVESTDPDWFDLGILVKIDGKTIPFEPLFTALSLRRKKLLLVDGSYFSLAHPALDRLRELIDEAATLAEWESGPKIARTQIALWEDFEDLADQSEPATAWRELVSGLRQVEQVPQVAVPPTLNAQLRPYQQAGFEWLAFLYRHGLGGILADDMGLGKTLQLLTLMLHATGSGTPFLVVAPTSVLPTWRSEAARFAPTLRTVVIDQTTSARGMSLAEAIADADVVITSYTLVRLDADEFAELSWAAAILDEAQFVKNPATQQYRAIAALKATVTFAVTGTPLENSLTDLWALTQLVSPGLFASGRKFRQEYVQPIEQGKVPENEEGSSYRTARIARLRRRLRPFMLRRTKELVATELPPKQEQVLSVELSPAHRLRYDAVLQRERQKVLGLLADLDRNRFIVFRSLTLLRMLSLAPGLVDEGDAEVGSRKLDVLVERLTELRAEGHRALVFSQFTSYLTMAAERLADAGIPTVYLDGATRRREKVIDDFRAGDQTAFLISLKAGGFGLTLTEADYVFLLDPWWNPAAEAQAVDRTHRIGQQEQVFVYRMIASDTIEEKVLALQQRKARLFTAVMDDEDAFAQSLTADDIAALFESDR